MGGVGILAGGLTFQQAVFRTAARQTHDELERLRTRFRRNRSAAVALEVTRGDLDAVRCTLLDGQGAEDMLLLTACNNFSVGVALAARLRCMTIQDVLDANPDLSEFLDDRRPRLLDSLVRLAGGGRPGAGGGAAAWAANHVFSDSYTNLAVADSARRKPVKRTVKGQVLVVPQGDANPGHLLDIDDALSQVADEMRAASPGRWPSDQVTPSADYSLFLSGRHDFLAPLGRRHGPAADVCGPRLPHLPESGTDGGKNSARRRRAARDRADGFLLDARSAVRQRRRAAAGGP